jgi:hypothetical protein
MGLLYWLGLDDGFGKLEVFAVKFGGIGCPDCLEDFDELARTFASCLHGCTCGIVFIFGPAKAEPNPQSAIRQDIQGGQSSRQQYRIVKGNVEHTCTQSNATCMRRSES